MWPRINDPPTDRGAAHGPAGGDLVEWRQRRLQRAGFDVAQAAELARQRAVDLHALIELVERGCPPGLAVRILAPLDQEPDQC